MPFLSIYGDTINRIDANDQKQGIWIETTDSKIYYGKYLNNRKDSVWAIYDKYSGKFLGQNHYSLSGNRKRMLRVIFAPPPIVNNRDSLIRLRVSIFDRSLQKGRSYFSSKLDSFSIEVESIGKQHAIYQIDKFSGSEHFQEIGFQKNREYRIRFSKKGYITNTILLSTDIPEGYSGPDVIHELYLEMSNKVLTDNDPTINGAPRALYELAKGKQHLVLRKNIIYEILQLNKNIVKDPYEKKSKIIEIENAVNEQIGYLKDEQQRLENEKRIKEEELRRNEAETRQKQLELDIMTKDKAMSQLLIKAKEAEIVKNKLLSEEKRKEIERLSQQNTINNLILQNKEIELKKRSIESQINASRIAGLNKETRLRQLESKQKTAELHQQKRVRNIFIGGFALLGGCSIVILRALQQNKKANRIISAQKLDVETKNHLIEEKQKEIIESITYAKHLQEAILPSKKFIDEFFPDMFIIYEPKDIVAGDFYWAETLGGVSFIAAADSTGHGVPGAMVSVVCSNALNRAIKEFHLAEPGRILDKTRELVLETFEKSLNDVKDGMDISLLSIDHNQKKVQWSGANNPLWYVKNNCFYELKADKQPIGKIEIPKPFTTHTIEYDTGTIFYLFTDGLADQFGGPNGKKYKYKQFSELLVANHRLHVQEQSALLLNSFNDWKGNLEQVDDVCVIGIRI